MESFTNKRVGCNVFQMHFIYYNSAETETKAYGYVAMETVA